MAKAKNEAVETVETEAKTAQAVKAGKKYIKTIPNTFDLRGIEITEETFTLPELDETQKLVLKNAIECGIIKEA